MKQATGRTKPVTPEKRVSIQLPLGGHSFSTDSLSPEIASGGAVEFVVLTPKTLLVPAEEFEPALAANYLRLAGMVCTPLQTAVWSDPTLPIVAVMAADAHAVASIREAIGDRVSFTSPLLWGIQHTASFAVWFYVAESLLYIKVYAPELQFAEVVCAQTEADFVYYLERLSAEFLLTATTARVSGDDCKRFCKLLPRYFKKIVCE